MKKSFDDEETFRLAEKRLLSAAGSDPVSPSPLFARRVIARARAAPGRAPLELFAWRLLPAMTVLTLALCGWGAYETSRLERATENIVSAISGQSNAPADAVLAAAFLGEGSQSKKGASR